MPSEDSPMVSNFSWCSTACRWQFSSPYGVSHGTTGLKVILIEARALQGLISTVPEAQDSAGE